MLTDPESYEEWEDVVWAKNEAKAWAACQEIAEEALLTEVINVTQVIKKPSKNGTYKFVCWFRSEVNPDDSSNP